MNDVSKPESATQYRVVQLLCQELGYRYLGDWTERAGNAPIEETLLTAFWQTKGYTPEQMSRALNTLLSEAANPTRTLYGNNQAVYSLLRYGVAVKTGAGEQTETVHLVDWDYPEANDFAVAEEVTLNGGLERRPDVVLYLNGLAVGVLELKNSRVSIGHGIRQNLSNQSPGFNEGFFATVQLVMAGNDSEGLQYGTIWTQEKYFLKWKEDEADNAGYKLDKYLRKLCSKPRLLEIVHDFVLFDAGIKKLPRVHQYFGIKAAQAHVQRRQGGIIWHTQGAGKSILMVLLARWILENLPKARVLIVTDRDELDQQIERVLGDAGETVYRTDSGKDLMRQLALPSPRLMCSLVHKFGGQARGKSEVEFEQFIKDVQAAPSHLPDSLLPPHQPVNHRHHQKRQQRRADHPADHGCRNALHHLAAGTHAPEQRQQAGHDGGHRHGLGPHPQHGTLPDGFQQRQFIGAPGVQPLLPRLLEVDQHDHAELGRHTGQCNEAHHAGHRQVVPEQPEKPHPAHQRERQRGHDQQRLVEAAEDQVKQHEDDQQRDRHHQLELGRGPLQELELPRPRHRVPGGQRHLLGHRALHVQHRAAQVAPANVHVHKADQARVFAAQHGWTLGDAQVGHIGQHQTLAAGRDDG